MAPPASLGHFANTWCASTSFEQTSGRTCRLFAWPPEFNGAEILAEMPLTLAGCSCMFCLAFDH